MLSSKYVTVMVTKYKSTMERGNKWSPSDGASSRRQRAVAITGLAFYGLATVFIFLLLGYCWKSDETIVLGYGGDVVYVTRIDSQHQVTLDVSEILLVGDYYHQINIYLVRETDLTTNIVNGSVNTITFYQADPSLDTGAVLFLYMLPRSFTDYNLCVQTENETAASQGAQLYVFNDLNSYYDFVTGTATGDSINAVQQQQLTIGAKNQSRCNQLNLNISNSSYYFITSETPGQIYYQYTAHSRIVRYNVSAYVRDCQLYGSDQCTLTVTPETPSILLAEIKALSISDPPTTHIHVVKYSQLSAFYTNLGFVCSLIFISLFVIVFIKVYAY